MGSITTSISNIIDTVTDLTAVKTGIILNKEDLAELLKDDFDFIVSHFNHPSRGVRLRSEEYEDLLLQVRYRLGDIADPRPGPMVSISLMMPWYEKGYNVISYQEQILDMAKNLAQDEKGFIDSKPIIDMLFNQGIPAELISDLFENIRINQDRNIYGRIANAVDFEGIELSKLFNSSLVGNRRDKFIEQKFINYLASNPHKLEHIHWRNFEAFCAEYFNQLGYQVELGPGTNDGGTDIVVRGLEEEMDTVIMIQCKRYNYKRDVSIEAVKAFYTDVDYETATKGIIATTSRIAPGGKTIATARKYPLEFAEAKEIRRWALNMHKPK